MQQVLSYSIVERKEPHIGDLETWVLALPLQNWVALSVKWGRVLQFFLMICSVELLGKMHVEAPGSVTLRLGDVAGYGCSYIEE